MAQFNLRAIYGSALIFVTFRYSAFCVCIFFRFGFVGGVRANQRFVNLIPDRFGRSIVLDPTQLRLRLSSWTQHAPLHDGLWILSQYYFPCRRQFGIKSGSSDFFEWARFTSIYLLEFERAYLNHWVWVFVMNNRFFVTLVIVLDFWGIQFHSKWNSPNNHCPAKTLCLGAMARVSVTV